VPGFKHGHRVSELSTTVKYFTSQSRLIFKRTLHLGYSVDCGFSDAFSNMADFGKLLVVLGILLVVAGLVLLVLGRTNLPLGRLPGDILYRGKHTTFYFPLATSILLSVLLSLILYVISRWRR
jgi:hypothetical protein